MKLIMNRCVKSSYEVIMMYLLLSVCLVDHMLSAAILFPLVPNLFFTSTVQIMFQELWSGSQNHQREVVGLGSEKLGV